MSNYREYLEMKKEGTVGIKGENDKIILTIQQRHQRTGKALPDLVQTVNLKQLENELLSISTERKRIKERFDKEMQNLDKRVLNIETLKKDAGV